MYRVRIFFMIFLSQSIFLYSSENSAADFEEIAQTTNTIKDCLEGSRDKKQLAELFK